MAIDLRVDLGGVVLRNPVLLASGTCGYGLELEPYIAFSKLGGFIAKSVTSQPREGNPMPRVAECSAGMLNAIGLANVGLERFCREKIPAMAKLPCAILANIAGSTEQEYLEVARRLNEQPELAALEVNVSCPNVKAGGIEFGKDPAVLEQLIRSLKTQTQKPLWVKLSPNVTDIRTLARAAEAGGADAICLINTLVGMRIDIKQRRPVLANRTGGLSGPAIKPVALHMVYQAALSVRVPIVGMGGIETAQDALEFIQAGASAVQIGTATFREPKTAEQIVRGLQDYCHRERVSRIQDLIGVALPQA
jgi:dihydroorotate dehydrogenase (NAD+) catalytic subunit